MLEQSRMKMSQAPRRIGIALAGLGLVMACENLDRSTAPVPTPSRAPDPTQQTEVKGSKFPRAQEEPFVRLANEVPGAAGYFIDNEHNLVVYVKDTTKASVARSVMSSHLARGDIGIPANQRPNRVLVRKADYDFQELSDWRDIVTENVLGSMGVILTDLAEQINRIRIVTEQSNSAQIIERIRELGIPAEAVRIETGGKIKSLSASYAPHRDRAVRKMTTHYLDGANDTLGGGMKYDNYHVGFCTIGFGADSGSNRIFMGPTHCTKYLFNLNLDTAKSNGIMFATESGDPNPGGYSCSFFTCWYWRSSDAASYSTIAGAGIPYVRRGMIARTVNRVAYAHATLEIHASNPWIGISGIEASYVTGTVTDKVGMVTGWAYNTINGSCIDVTDNSGHAGNWAYYCNGQSGISVEEGDSGAPIFVYDGADGATLYGMASLHSYNPPLGVDDVIWTPIGGIQTDFGSSWNVLSDITVTPISGVSASVTYPNQPHLTWTASTVTHSSRTTEYKIYRSLWDASTYSFTEADHYIGSTTGTGMTDGTWSSGVAYLGTLPTGSTGCIYSEAWYRVVAYNNGIAASSATYVFQGAADGPTPALHSCW